MEFVVEPTYFNISWGVTVLFTFIYFITQRVLGRKMESVEYACALSIPHMCVLLIVIIITAITEKPFLLKDMAELSHTIIPALAGIVLIYIERQKNSTGHNS